MSFYFICRPKDKNVHATMESIKFPDNVQPYRWMEHIKSGIDMGHLETPDHNIKSIYHDETLFSLLKHI